MSDPLTTLFQNIETSLEEPSTERRGTCDRSLLGRSVAHQETYSLSHMRRGLICEPGCTFRHEVRTPDEEFLEQVCCVGIDCKISSRSSYSYGWRFCANPVRPDPRKTFEKLCYTWFHVRMGAGSLDVVKGRKGRAKTSPWKELEVGIARSRRDLTISGVGG